MERCLNWERAMRPKLLIIDDEPEIARYVAEIMASLNFEANLCGSTSEAEQRLLNQKYDLVISDIHLPGTSGIKLLENLTKNSATNTPFIFISGNADPKIVEKAARLGAADVIQKPFTADELISAVKRLKSRGSDKIKDLMEMIQSISGITLGEDKRSLVETRLLRRIRQLKINSLDGYHEYFKNHRDTEVSELVSLITTHTTHFFRESGHFDYLMDTAFPRLIQSNPQTIKVWSAASSSGEEAYSIAMCYQEFLKSRGKDPSSMPKLSVLGTDIDFNIIEVAKKGIYPKQSVQKISKTLVSRYFDSGRGSLAEFVRVKDDIHKMCQFRQINLIGREMPSDKFDIVFLRNVLIYFKPEFIKRIIQSIGGQLNPNGVLILGHSESLSGLNLPFDIIGNSIYTPKTNNASTPIALKSEATQPPSAIKKKKTRVFIIDDSATIRKMLRRVFEEDSSFEVTGEAENPSLIKGPLDESMADVVTLDIHMPVMDGITYLKTIQGKKHAPIVMISSVNYQDGVDYMNCLELGAVDYIEKPNGLNLNTEAERIRHVVKAAGSNKVKNQFGEFGKRSSKNVSSIPVYHRGPKDLIVIGASTGGIDAIKVVLESFPKESPPVVIVQHIPELFSKTFADRLSQICPIKVSEARHQEVLEPNHAYIAPGGKQLGVLAQGYNTLVFDVSDAPPVNRHKPSVDFLFKSVLPHTSSYRISAAILTGMGGDGAQGLLELRKAGCYTVAQDEESCVVFGMPKVAIEIGAAADIVPLPSIAYHLFKAFKDRSAAA